MYIYKAEQMTGVRDPFVLFQIMCCDNQLVRERGLRKSFFTVPSLDESKSPQLQIYSVTTTF